MKTTPLEKEEQEHNQPINQKVCLRSKQAIMKQVDINNVDLSYKLWKLYNMNMLH